MKVKFFCPHWGSALLSYSVFFEKVKEAGYDGVEMSLPFDKKEKSEFYVFLRSLTWNLWPSTGRPQILIPIYTGRFTGEHLLNLAEADPLFINSQTGKDYFSFEENAELIDIAFRVEEETGIPVVHETHRGKFSFALHITSRYLERIPDLELGLDLSHWCNVAESLLHDQQDSLDLALSPHQAYSCESRICRGSPDH